jgi:hypothetical protein
MRARLAGLAAAGAVMFAASSARADDCTAYGVNCPGIRGPFTPTVGAIVAGALGLSSGIVGLLPLLAPGAQWSRVNRGNTGLQIFWYATGGLAVTLGAIGVGVQATVGLGDENCPDIKSCRAAYGLSGAAIGVGAIDLALGIVASTTPEPPPGKARWIPMPMLLPAARGVAPGVGIVTEF